MITNFIQYLQALEPEIVSAITLVFCYAFIIIMAKFWHEIGLITYMIIAMIACNIQVLQVTNFLGFSQPIALGTIVYASTFMVNDLLTEIYGKSYAKKAVQLGFASSLIFVIMMILTIGHRKLFTHSDGDYDYYNKMHDALNLIFLPNIGIVCASLSAYFISQYLEIYLFSNLKKLTKNCHLWLRVSVSISIAALVDSTIFSILAWKIFVPLNISWHNLIYTYIVGSFVIQITVAAINIPVFYCAIKFLRK